MSRHSTGITIVLTLALAAGLSFAPLPDALRPFPALSKQPVDTLVAAVLPKKRGAVKQQDAITGAPELADAAPIDTPSGDQDARPLPVEMDEPDEPAPPLPPSATLGVSEAREVRKLERWAKKVGAKHVDIEQGCLKNADDGTCLVQALDPLFDKLEALQRGEAKEHVRIVHLGDSQIASDHITDVVRRRLELRYGSGGPGFLYVDRPTRFAGRKVRTGEASDGWEVVKLTDKVRDGILGFTGVRFISKGAQHSRFDVSGARAAELFFATSPRGGTLEVSADEKPLTHVLTRFDDTELAFARVKLPKGARELDLRADDREVHLLGVSLERPGPGIVYDTVGLPGALFEVYLRSREKVFAAQLQHRNPSLVIVMLGGNEAYEIGRGWQTLDDAKKHAQMLVDRIHKAAPDAACLLMSPMDAGIRNVSGEIQPRPHTVEVGRMIREVALSNGCAFWDLHEAMGGEGSVPNWLSHGLFNEDLIHPLARGADLLGHLFDFALERARTARQVAQRARPMEPAGLQDASRLAQTLHKLDAVKADPSLPSVRVVQLGASHTASHMFTDVARAELVKRSGDAGRGFVAAGRPSDRLLPYVARDLLGEWTITDAREGGPDERWGLTGIRAVGAQGAVFRIAFKKTPQARSGPAELSLYYLASPDMGRMAVRIDGERAGEVSFERAERPAPREKADDHGGRTPKDPEVRLATQGRAPSRDPRPPAHTERAQKSDAAQVRVVTFPVDGTAHTLEVENLGPGPITVFGASLEQPQGGVVWDALGLPGATAILVDGYDRASFVEQLRARRADLYVLFFGTNEAEMAGFSPELLRAHERALLAKLKEASPSAECLILGPTDRLQRGEDEAWAEAPHLEEVIRVLREVASEQGCAFWSARAAMGGPWSMARWQSLSPPLAMEDGVHLTKEGYTALAQALVDDLLGAKR